MTRQETMQKIIFSAIECIEEHGIDEVTMRLIAIKAGINLAMLNYYYGSKENIINAAMQTTLNEAFINNLDDYNDQWSSNPRGALQSLLYETFNGMLNYPNITKSHFHEILINNNYESASAKGLTGFLKRLFGYVKGIMTGQTESEKWFSFTQMISSLLMMGLMPGLFCEAEVFDLFADNARRTLINDLVSRFVRV